MNETLVALIGVLVSVTASLLVSIRRTNVELKKHRIEIQDMYMDKLLEQRMKYYPLIYAQISKLVKKIRSNDMTKTELIEFRDNILEWDSSHSLYFSMGTGYRFHNFYMHLAVLCQKNDSEFQEFLSNEEYLTNFRKKLSGLELALKADLGILPVDFAETGKKFEVFEDYIDNLELMKRKKVA